MVLTKLGNDGALMSRLSKYEGGFSLIHRDVSFVDKQNNRIMIKCIGSECWMNDTPIQPDGNKLKPYRTSLLSHYFRLTQLDSIVDSILKRGFTYSWSKGFNNGNYLGEFVREFDYLQTSLV